MLPEKIAADAAAIRTCLDREQQRGTDRALSGSLVHHQQQHTEANEVAQRRHEGGCGQPHGDRVTQRTRVAAAVRHVLSSAGAQSS